MHQIIRFVTQWRKEALPRGTPGSNKSVIVQYKSTPKSTWVSATLKPVHDSNDDDIAYNFVCLSEWSNIHYITWNNFPLPGVQCAGHPHCSYSLVWFLPAPHPQSDWSSVVGALHYRQPAPADTVYIKCFHSELNNYLIKSLQLKVHIDLKCK